MTLSELKELAQKATPGPWAHDLAYEIVDKNGYSIAVTNDCDYFSTAYANEVCRLNADFIEAANPQVVLQLIERIEKLSNAIKNFEERDTYSYLRIREAVLKYGADVELN